MRNLLNQKVLEQNIEQIVNYDFEHNKIFGSAYWVFQKGNIVYQKCFGTAVSEHTIFRLASMTKPITAVATLILVERGLLSLSDPIAKFIPEFGQIHVMSDGKKESLKTPITIRQLLSHTSGIGANSIKSEKMTAKEKQTIDTTIQFVLQEGLDYQPESREEYSGYGAYDVLTRICSIVGHVEGEIKPTDDQRSSLRLLNIYSLKGVAPDNTYHHEYTSSQDKKEYLSGTVTVLKKNKLKGEKAKNTQVRCSLQVEFGRA